MHLHSRRRRWNGEGAASGSQCHSCGLAQNPKTQRTYLHLWSSAIGSLHRHLPHRPVRRRNLDGLCTGDWVRWGFFRLARSHACFEIHRDGGDWALISSGRRRLAARYFAAPFEGKVLAVKSQFETSAPARNNPTSELCMDLISV